MKDKHSYCNGTQTINAQKMNRIVIIEDGKIVEDGLPEDLLKRLMGYLKECGIIK